LILYIVDENPSFVSAIEMIEIPDELLGTIFVFSCEAVLVVDFGNITKNFH
jgi:hypothetical protein